MRHSGFTEISHETIKALLKLPTDVYILSVEQSRDDRVRGVFRVMMESTSDGPFTAVEEGSIMPYYKVLWDKGTGVARLEAK